MFNMNFNKKFCYILLGFVIISMVFLIKENINAYTPSKTIEGISAFPADYQAKLVELQKKHSNWKFVAVNTYLNWNDVVSSEMANGKSLVSTSLPSSWQRDSTQIEPGWVNASKTAVEYSLDPRNFLNEEKIFQFELSNFNSDAHTKEAVEEVLSGTDMYKNTKYKNNNNILDMNETYSQIIYDASKNSGVSAVHVASRIIQENGGKVYTNKSINGSTAGYIGYYNFMNIGAYCTDNCGKPYIHGLQYAKDNGWTSPKIAIEAASNRIKKIWVNYGQNTVYFEKWDVNYVSGAIGLYTNQYMTNITAPSTESTMMYNAYKRSDKLNSSFVFYIPVYYNMPNSENTVSSDDTLVYLDDTSDSGVDDTFILRAEASEASNVVGKFTFNDSNKVSKDTPYIVVRKKIYSSSLYDYVEIYDRANMKAYYGYMLKSYICEYPKNKLTDAESPTINLSYTYNASDNSVTVMATSNEILKNNKSTWTYGNDKKSMTKKIYENTSYSTVFYDDFNNATASNIKVTGVDETGPVINVKYVSNSDGTVTVSLVSNEALKEDKSAKWKLSSDKKTYTKIFNINDAYTADVRDIYSNETKVDIKVTGVKAYAKVTYNYNKDSNTVTASMYCENGFKNTKPTWTLSSDSKTYTKTFDTNTTYSTSITDLLGNTGSVSLKIEGIQDNIVTKVYDSTKNTVTVKLKSATGYKKTKPTWTLSSDNLTYTKVYEENGKYTTKFTMLNGTSKDISFEITEIDETAPNITITKKFDSDNGCVIVTATSNEILSNTKPTWSLDSTKKIYTKKYNENGKYKTYFTDAHGNVKTVEFEVSEIKQEYKITKNYDEKSNTVSVVVSSNIKFKKTKPTWTLSEDMKSYTKAYTDNGTYKTPFVNINGSVENLSFEITEIKSGYTVNNEYDEKTNTVLVTVTCKKMLKDTKPTWKLAQDKMSYKKTYTDNGIYKTPFVDINGKTEYISFEVNEIKSGYMVNKEYDEKTNAVVVTVTSKKMLKDTKPTWKLSQDKMSYTKTYKDNGTYKTPFVDINEKVENISFEITEIDEKGPSISIKKEYNMIDNVIKITAVSNEVLSKSKPTWEYADNLLSCYKEYEEPVSYKTVFADKNSNKTNVEINMEELTLKRKYDKEENIVTVVLSSKNNFKETKPTWTLDSTKKNYSKDYDKNGTYTTLFSFENGNEIYVTFKVDEIIDEEQEESK